VSFDNEDIKNWKLPAVCFGYFCYCREKYLGSERSARRNVLPRQNGTSLVPRLPCWHSGQVFKRTYILLPRLPCWHSGQVS